MFKQDSGLFSRFGFDRFGCIIIITICHIEQKLIGYRTVLWKNIVRDCIVLETQSSIIIGAVVAVIAS